MSNPNTIDDQLDHLVDTRQISYTEAYGVLGIPVPSDKPIMSDAIQARLEDQAYYSREFRLTGDVQLSPEQQMRNHLGAEAVMAALDEAKKKS